MNRNPYFDGFSGIKQEFMSKAQTSTKYLRTALDTQKYFQLAKDLYFTQSNKNFSRRKPRQNVS